MITKQTENYRALFEKASQLDVVKAALGAMNPPRAEITSLNEYFGLLELIVNNTQGDDAYKYLMLPVDEPTFDINADTRSIAVPNEFKNLASVKGDQIAESIFFSIDRYFDHTDLDTQKICIQWKNAAGEEGISSEWVRDIESQPGKIVFGWALDDTITKEAGRVEFAVRFYTVDQNSVIYSFSTIPQMINISKTLDYNLEEGDYIGLSQDQTKELIIGRVKASANAGPDVAETPRFVEPKAEQILDLSLESGTAPIYAQAISSDGGILTYKLVTYNSNGESSSGLGNINQFKKQSNLSKFENDHVYYTKVNESGVDSYKIAKTYEVDTEYYEKVAETTVDKVGTYTVQVDNAVGFAHASAESYKFIVPSPEPANITIENTKGQDYQSIIMDGSPLSGKATVKYSKKDKNEISFAWYKEGNSEALPNERAASFTTNEDGIYYAVISSSRNKETVESEEKPRFRITHKASQPIFGEDTTEETTFNGALAHMNSFKSPIKIAISKPEYVDGITIEQYEFEVDKESETGTEDALEQISQAMDNGFVDFTPSASYSFGVDKLDAINLSINCREHEGKFICVKITNSYNGSEATNYRKWYIVNA